MTCLYFFFNVNNTEGSEEKVGIPGPLSSFTPVLSLRQDNGISLGILAEILCHMQTYLV